MRRILVILNGEVDGPSLRSRCHGLADGNALALCYQLPEHADLEQGLRAQRHLTELLRAMFGAAAEEIPIFVATDREGERADDLAAAWGATEVNG